MNKLIYGFAQSILFIFLTFSLLLHLMSWLYVGIAMALRVPTLVSNHLNRKLDIWALNKGVYK